MSFIILGNQRSGTSFLLDLVNQHPLVDTINEPFSMHLDYFRGDETMWYGKDYSEDCLHPALSHYPETNSFIRGLRDWLNFEFPTVRGFKETGLFEKYDWLKETLHFDQTIIIVRDFRAVIYSVLRRNLHRGWWDYEKRLNDFYQYIGPSDDHIICAELLKKRTNHLINIIHNYPCHITKLEDLLCNPLNELNMLMNYIELDFCDKRIVFLTETSSETRDFAYSNYRRKEDVMEKWKRNLKPSIIADINDILKDQLCFLGYEL